MGVKSRTTIIITHIRGLITLVEGCEVGFHPLGFEWSSLGLRVFACDVAPWG